MELFADTIISLAVHAASALEDEQVVNWLIGFQEFSLEQFNNSRKILGITDPGRRKIWKLQFKTLYNLCNKVITYQRVL